MCVTKMMECQYTDTKWGPKVKVELDQSDKIRGKG